MINLSVLPKKQQQVFTRFQKFSLIHDYYLAGGTALALQIGHRQSIDFDFFSKKNINTTTLTDLLKSIGDFELFSEEKNTLHGQIDNVQVSFLKYDYTMIGPFVAYENIRIASIKDIACMKLSAISSRGTKKDFIDFFFILKQHPLPEIFLYYESKFGKGLLNEYHFLKSLVYFTDAERDAMPVMKEKISWKTVKNKMIEIVQQYQKSKTTPS